MTHEKRKAQQREYNKRFYAKNREREKARAKAWRAENKEQVKVTSKAWRKANPERYAEMKRDWDKRNPDRVAATREKRRPAALAKAREYKAVHKEELAKRRRPANPESNRARASAWAKQHPERANARAMRHHAAKLNAIPSWADHDKIKAIYAEAVRLTKETGIKHEVDHIYPLQSKVMCGLHWEANLQILPMFENRSKSNRRWPETHPL